MSALKNRVAIVTGSSSGIGQSIAVRLAGEGANIVVDYVGHREGADETLKQVTAAGARGIIVNADVSNMAAVRDLVDQAWKTFGSADILVNNAGMEKKSDFWDTPEEDYDRVLGVNLKGPFFLTQAFVQRLRATKKPGRVINISSVHEDMAFPGFATYCASKGGLRMLMRDLAVELGPYNITVNNIAPGAIATSQCNSLSVSTGSPPARFLVLELEKLIVEPSRAMNSLCVEAAGTSGSVTSNGWATPGGRCGRVNVARCSPARTEICADSCVTEVGLMTFPAIFIPLPAAAADRSIT